MINRDNYHAARKYLTYLGEVKQNVAQTVKRRRSQLRHLLEWADETPFQQAHLVRPTFPTYLSTARNDDRDGSLAASTLKGICRTAQAFFFWIRDKHPRRYRSLAETWIETLKAPKTVENVKERELFTFDNVQRLIQIPTETLTNQRDQAAVAFLFLSGIRVGAFVTLPIHAIDLENRQVKQWPSFGVRTKNRKAATTYLLDIPGLMETVVRWDGLVRAELSPDALWYATLARDGMHFTGNTCAGKDRGSAVAKGIRRLCQYADITYHSPHKLRHGHVVYAMQRATTIASLKAISQNLMHARLATTDSVYGVLPENDLKARIAALTQTEQSS
ncbi:MAG: site-specific integrase, partial [Proteobacteria bacterium]|nr:site-specific integrase [Pseudomonadota bacterium]